MFETERMKKLVVICTKKEQPKIISKLHELKVMHIIDHKKTGQLDIGEPLENSEKISSLLVKAKAYVSNFNIKLAPRKAGTGIFGKQDISENQIPLKKIEAELSRFEEKHRELSSELKNTETALASKENVFERLEIMKKLQVSLYLFREYKNLSVFLGTVKCPHEKIGEVKKKIEGITSRFQFRSTPKTAAGAGSAGNSGAGINSGTETVIAVFADTQKKEKVQEILKEYNYSEIPIKDIFDAGMHDFEKSLLKLRIAIKELRKNREILTEEINKLVSSHKQDFADFEYVLGQELEKHDAPLKFAVTKETSIIYGWVPEKRIQKVKEELEASTKNIYFEEKEIEKGDPVPIVLKNPWLAKPFEFFMNMYTLPRYKEIDPTFFMFITFPLFFGIMLGDAVYGIITLALFIFLRIKMPNAKMLLNAMIICALVTICFGGIYGEYLGYEEIPAESSFGFIGEKLNLHLVEVGAEESEAAGGSGEVVSEERTEEKGGIHKVYEIPRLLKRTHDNIGGVPLVLILGAAIGILHLNFGFIIGFINEFKAHGFKTAFFEKISWMFLQAGIALTLLSLTKVISLTIFAGLAIMIFALWMLYKAEGIRGLIEFPSILSNVMSYMRLGALGLASVYLALVINEYLAAPFFEKGGIFTVVAILIMIIGHTVNIALGIIGPFLHSLRLHYVEFFSKFYKGGGIKFQPFGAEKD